MKRLETPPLGNKNPERLFGQSLGVAESVMEYMGLNGKGLGRGSCHGQFYVSM